MWQTNIFTIFPEAFPGTLGISVIGKALEQKIWRMNLVDLKKFPAKSDRIDSYPYGGGVGMLLSTITFEKAFNSLSEHEKKFRRIYCSPRGRKMTQMDFEEISRSSGLTILCGRYEGVDQRILNEYEMEEISIGDFVLLGGEVAAMAIVEGCVRLLPGVVGDSKSVDNDSFQENLLEYDQYTKPEIFKGRNVPSVLLSGDHGKIAQYRNELSKQMTMKKRPDLWAKYIEENMRKK